MFRLERLLFSIVAEHLSPAVIPPNPDAIIENSRHRSNMPLVDLGGNMRPPEDLSLRPVPQGTIDRQDNEIGSDPQKHDLDPRACRKTLPDCQNGRRSPHARYKQCEEPQTHDP